MAAPMPEAARPNARWSLDFLSDTFGPSRRFARRRARTGGALRLALAVNDDCCRESLCLVADTSISGARVARELDALIRRAEVLSASWEDATGALEEQVDITVETVGDVLELAAIAGTTAAGNDPSTDLLDAVADLAAECTDGFPAAADLLTDAARDRLTRTVTSPYADH